MEKAELAKLTKPGFQWIQDWESGKIKELPTKEHLVSQLEKLIDNIKKKGEMTLAGFLACAQTCVFIQERDGITGKELFKRYQTELKKATAEA
jgi:hypothetical protein